MPKDNKRHKEIRPTSTMIWGEALGLGWKHRYSPRREGKEDGRHHFADPIHEVAQSAEQAETPKTNRAAHVGSQRCGPSRPYWTPIHKTIRSIYRSPRIDSHCSQCPSQHSFLDSNRFWHEFSATRCTPLLPYIRSGVHGGLTSMPSEGHTAALAEAQYSYCFW